MQTLERRVLFSVPPLVTTFATVGHGPDGLAFDKQGNLYVANYFNNTIGKVTPAGVVSTFITKGGDGVLNEPKGLAIDSSGHLFVAANNANGYIAEYSSTGQLVKATFNTSALSGAPDQMIIDASNNLFVYVTSSTGTGAVLKITPSGVVSTYVAGLDKDAGGMAFDGHGKLYVTNFGGNSIEVVPPGGGSFSPFGGAVNQPRDIVIDHAGTIYVSSGTDNAIDRVSPSGNVTPFVSGGPLNNYPYTLALDAKGILYATNGLGNTVVRIDPTPPAAATGPASNILTTAATLAGAVLANGRSTTTSFQYGTNSDLTSTLTSGFGYITQIAADAAGNVYGSSSSRGEVVQVGPTGAVKVLDAHYQSQVVGIGTDAAGDVFAASNGLKNTIVEYAHGGGGAIKTFNLSSTPQLVGVDAHGDIFFTSSINGGSIQEIPAGSTTAHQLANGISTALIAVDAAGDVFLVDSTATEIDEIPHNGSIRLVQTGFGQIGALACDAVGDLFAYDFNTKTVSEVIPGQSPLVIWNSPFDLSALCVSANGTLFADTTSSTVIRVTPYSIAAKPSPATGVAISAALGGLRPGTDYYYRAVANSGTIANGATAKFTTASATAVTGAATAITAHGAALHATVNGHGSSTATQFQISTSPTFTTQLPVGVVAATSLAVDSAGDVIFYNQTAKSLQRLTPAGVTTTLATGVPFPISMAVGNTGNVFLAPAGQAVILEYRPGKSTLTFNLSVGANSVAVDGSDNIYALNAAGVTEIPVSGPAKVLPTGFAGQSIAVDAAGDVFYGSNVGRTLEELVHGGTVPQIVATGLGLFFGLAIDGNGDLFTTNFSTGVVTEIPKGGVPFVLDPAHRMQVATSPSGQVYATDSATGHLFSLTPLTVPGSPASVSGTSNVALSATVAGLLPGTTYYYRPILKYNGITTFGEVKSFKTAAK